MTRRKFDRYMIAISIGTHPRLATLDDGEFRAHVAGVLSIAAMARVRGLLLVGDRSAEPVHVARAAGVTVKVAASAIAKLTTAGVLEHDDEYDCLRVHDWIDYNPEPSASNTPEARAERQRLSRARRGLSRDGHANVTRDKPVTSRVSHAAEVEVEVEAKTPSSHLGATGEADRDAEQAIFDEWVKATGRTSSTDFDDKRRKLIRRALGWKPADDVVDAVRGVARSEHHMSNRQWSELKVVLRDVSQIEHFRDLQRGQNGRKELRSSDLVDLMPGNREMNAEQADAA